MIHGSTECRSGRARKREKEQKKTKRKKQRKTREEKGTEEIPVNFAAAAEVCPGLNRYYFLKGDGRAASRPSISAAKR